MTHACIVIVGYRNPDDIIQCLDHVARQDHRDFSVWICENGGEEAYAQLTARMEQDGLLEPSGARAGDTLPARIDGRFRGGGQLVAAINAGDNLGYAGGINVCLRAIAARFDGCAANWSGIWILNPDTQPAPGALGALIGRQREGDYAIVGSRLALMQAGTIQLYAGRWRTWMARGFNIGLGKSLDHRPDVAAIEAQADYVSGASLYASREFVAATGPMDEGYFLYCEEVDWCLRRGAGRIGYAHDSVVLHAHGTTIGSSITRSGRSALSVYLDERSRLLLTRRHFPGRFWFVAIATLLLTGQYAAEGAWTNWRYALAGWWAGLRDEVGFPERFRT